MIPQQGEVARCKNEKIIFETQRAKWLTSVSSNTRLWMRVARLFSKGPCAQGSGVKVQKGIAVLREVKRKDRKKERIDERVYASIN